MRDLRWSAGLGDISDIAQLYIARLRWQKQIFHALDSIRRSAKLEIDILLGAIERDGGNGCTCEDLAHQLAHLGCRQTVSCRLLGIYFHVNQGSRVGQITTHISSI